MKTIEQKYVELVDELRAICTAHVVRVHRECIESKLLLDFISSIEFVINDIDN